MASIMTNASALTALQSLNATNKNLETTQSRISTGYRVAEASDNAAYWSIATTMRSDKSSLSVVQDTLGLGASKVDTAYTNINKTIDTVNAIKDKLVAASGASTADKAKIQVEVSALQASLKMTSDGATAAGSNWLSVDTTSGQTAAGTHDDAKIVAAYTRNSAGKVALQTIDVDVQSVKLYEAYASATNTEKGILDGTRLASSGARDNTAVATVGNAAAAATDGYAVSTLTVVGFNDTQIADMINVVDTASKELTDAATKLGAAKVRIDLQKNSTQSLMDSIDRGVGQLVDADMNKESTRLQALQVQQQLGIQALSIANGNSQSILSLFR
ncbi:flagellin [Mesorhizobium sp. NBSH29]|uniref:flagellin N-terminal helical domain-containing protein n=1 Tax=Mesorhizobium sp. NBSH29 TaxID=2654249 RepID=UPI0018966FFA|nr:flagellin [Mesorhizobium sp. NBSH29]QPC85394.1 flagellin [Mesorhizobium sp. NBSH29]